MADETIVLGNGKQVLAALNILQKYEGKRAKLDVNVNDKDAVIVYLNAAEAKFQPKVKPEDVEAIEELGFLQSEEGDYKVFALY